MRQNARKLMLCALCTALPLIVLVASFAAAEAWLIQIRVTTFSSPYRTSREPHVSADGSRIVFSSDSDFLAEGLPGGQFELWLHDTRTLNFTRLTTTSHTGRVSLSPSLNANGTHVVFESDSDLRGQGILSGQFEIWLFNTATMTLTRITTASEISRESHKPSINADGTKIVFESDSDFLGQGIPDDQFEIWLYDTTALKLTRITTASLPDRSSLDPVISADGTRIAFESDSDFLQQGLPRNPNELWLFDTATLTYTRLTNASHSNRRSIDPTISSDGTRIAFGSDSDLRSQGIISGQYEIWLFDTTTVTLTRITTSSNPLERRSQYAEISGDGTRIVFDSDSDFLNQGIPDTLREVWLYDLTTMTLTRITKSRPYATSRDSQFPSIDADGNSIVFQSDSSFNLPVTLPDNQYEVWLFKAPVSSLYLPVIRRN